MADRLLPSTAISLRSGSSPHARQALPTKPITERLRVLRLGKTEQHQVNASAAHGIGKRRHRPRPVLAIVAVALADAGRPAEAVELDEAIDQGKCLRLARHCRSAGQGRPDTISAALWRL